MRGTRQILGSLFRVNSAIIHSMQEIMQKLDLSIHQLWILITLAEMGPMSIRELTRRTESAYSTVSGMVERLEEMELVSRRRSELDRRIIHVYPTQRFLELYQGEESGVTGWLYRVLEEAPEREREQIQEGLKSLEDRLWLWKQEQVGEGSSGERYG